MPGNFNDQVQAAVRVNVDHDVDVFRPRHWEYVDYDEYHRPSFYNPLVTDMIFRYFYNGDYRTVFVPAGGRLRFCPDISGVFPFTAVAGDYVLVGSFRGGCWVPPVGWVGPPPADWQPPEPLSYPGVAVDFPQVGQTVQVDQVTVVGHDDSQPAGQRDVVMLDDSTLARGEITPSPDGGPPQVTLQQTQSMPGVGPWDDGHQYINASIQKPIPPPSKISLLPIVLIVLVVAVAILSAAEYTRRRRHRRRQAPRHIQAVPRAGAFPVVVLRETPEHGEATHALRLEAHSGLSTLTVREVDR